LRRGWLWWLAVLVPIWIVLALCAYWEPVLRDGWVHADWHRQLDVGVRSLWRMIDENWRLGNPRLGQIFTLLAFTPGAWHVAITPLAELGLFVLLTALVLGRWPSPRRADDALLLALIVALVFVCAPQIGPMLLYRPITGNYTHSFALNLLWLVPYRFHIEAPRGERLHLAPVLAALGLAAGFCNEHTGPAFLALGAAAVIASRRRGDRIRLWMIAGLVGFLIGYVLLIAAPGQSARYDGLARKASLLERIGQRGLAANLAIVGKLLLALWPAAIALGIGAAASRWLRPPPLARKQRLVLLAGAAAGLLSTLTLLASPKLGARLYFASVALCCAALAGWVVSRLAGDEPRARRLRAACAALAGAAIAYVLAMLATTYHAVGPYGAARLAAIMHGAPGAAVVVAPYPVPGGRWFIGEDFDSDELRAALAVGHGLSSITLDPAPRPGERAAN
jgi:hypothetical protein